MHIREALKTWIRFVFLIITLFFLCASILFSAKANPDLTYEWLTLEPISLFEFVSIILILPIAVLIFQKIQLPSTFTFILATTLSICIVFLSGYIPVGDQYLLLHYGHEINQGIRTSIEPLGYFAMYPQQIALLSLARVLIVLFKDYALLAFGILNAIISNACLVWSGKWILDSYKQPRAQTFFNVLFLTCAPIFFYMPYFYGDILYVSIFLMGYACLLRSHRHLAALLIGISILIRANGWIFFCAVALDAFLRSRNIKWLIEVVGVYLIMRMLICSAYSELSLSKGIPASLYIAMGLQADGWYNAFTVQTYLEFAGNEAMMKSYATEQIIGTLQYFLRFPKTGLYFYWRKFATQWLMPSGHVFQMVYAYAKPLVPTSMQHFLWHFTDAWMNIAQIMYGLGMALAGYRMGFKKAHADHDDVLLYILLGGVLFSLLWEAKARYVFPYIITSLPLIALGLSSIAKQGNNQGKEEYQ